MRPSWYPCVFGQLTNDTLLMDANLTLIAAVDFLDAQRLRQLSRRSLRP